MEDQGEIIHSQKLSREEAKKKLKINQRSKTLSRREFISLAAGTIGSLILAREAGILNTIIKPDKKTQVTPTLTYPEVPPQSPQKIEKQRTFKDLLNEVLELPLKSRQRLQKENEFLLLVKNTKEISPVLKLKLVDFGFCVISDSEIRTELLDARKDLREKGNTRLLKLTEQQLKWVEKQKIHPEVLGVCLDAEAKAKEAIATFLKINKDDFRADFAFLEELKLPHPGQNQLVTPENIMINPGGMAQLICYETGYKKNGVIYGFCNIGAEQAISQINTSEKAFPNDIIALEELCKLLSADTGLNYIPENIPGSKWKDKHINLSGGAIGLQFMPSKALRLYKRLEGAGIKFNPFDLESSVIGAWVFLAEGDRVGNDVRFGYFRGDDKIMRKSLLKWNPFEPQVEIILSAAKDYYNQIIYPNLIAVANSK